MLVAFAVVLLLVPVFGVLFIELAMAIVAAVNPTAVAVEARHPDIFVAVLPISRSIVVWLVADADRDADFRRARMNPHPDREQCHQHR